MIGFQWYGDEILGRVDDGIKKALMEAGADLQQKSVAQAPIDTGELRDSCAVEETGGLSITVGYTKSVDAYSMVQHERLDFSHPRGGKAKYLEDPFNENKEKYVQHIGQAVKEAL